MKLLVCFILLAFNFSFGTERPFHIVIDPGHGGADLGAIRGPIVEAEITLSVAKKVKTLLDAQGKQIQTTLTRSANKSLSLQERVQIANDLKADLYVSLHANTSPYTSINGMEFYFNSTNPKPLDSKSMTQAQNIFPNANEVIEKIKSDFEFYNKTEKSLSLAKTFKKSSAQLSSKGVIKRASYFVVDHTDMPSALVELGFITNQRDAKKLISTDYQNQLATFLTSALLEFKEKSDK